MYICVCDYRRRRLRLCTLACVNALPVAPAGIDHHRGRGGSTEISPPSLASNILSPYLFFFSQTSAAPVAAHSLVITQIGIDGAGFRHLPLLKLVNSFVSPERRSSVV